jgi:uncharacterized membrane protein
MRLVRLPVILINIKTKRNCCMNREPENRSKKEKTSYVGSGIALGASLGLIFGLLLLDSLALGLAFGVAIGIVIGAIADAQAAKNRQK